MTPEEFYNKDFDKIFNLVLVEMKPVMEIAALSAKALVALRVQNTGFGKQYKSEQYKRYRVRNNHQIQFVDLTFTGNMFRELKKANSEIDGLVVTGSVESLTVEGQMKLNWNKSRYPTFDQLSEDDKEKVDQVIINGFVSALNTYFK